MIKKIQSWLGIAAAVLAIHGSILANDFYVDVQNGSDLTGDGSAGNPWKTITLAAAQVTGNRDVIHVAPGIYSTGTGESFPISPFNGVDLVAQSGPDVTILQGDGQSPVLKYQQAQSILSNRIEGFTIRGGTDGVEVLENPGNILVTIANSTICHNGRAGVYSGAGSGTSNVEVFESTVRSNQYGWLHVGNNTAGGLAIRESEFAQNYSDGLRLSVSSGLVNIDVESSLIRNNGGIGWNQSADLYGGIQSVLTNTTISGNAAGGVKTHADYWVQYVPPYGPIRTDPIASVSLDHSVVTANGGSAATVRSGTSFSSRGGIGRSICWGNIGLDNSGFQTGFSNVGTGDISGLYDISADPKWVDAVTSDYRLLFDSPCIDMAADDLIQVTDFEGEVRPFDGNGDGVPFRDMGIDEFHFFVAPLPAPAVGQPFSFIAQGPPAENGRTALVLISGSDGNESGGFTLRGGVHVDLTPDALHNFGLKIIGLLQTPITAQQGQTATITLPPAALGVQVFYAGVTFDWNTTLFTTGTPTRSFVIQ